MKKKKVSSTGSSAREKMMARKKKLSEKRTGGGFIYVKDGTMKVRLKSPGEDEEIGIEVIYFFVGGNSIYSPATFDEPCPWMEKYKELKESSDPDDKELAKSMVPKRKYAVGGGIYTDAKSKNIDPESIDKPILIPQGVYQDIIDYYLDEDEWGDMTDREEGYDLKINRSGKGKNDTKYSVSPCSKSRAPKELKGYIDLEKAVRASIPGYNELQEKLDDFLNGAGQSDDEDEKPKKKKEKSDKKSKDKKKKKRRDDDDDDLPF